MPSKTSFFNKGIFLNNIKRFWLITFSYTFFLFLFTVGYLKYIPDRLNSVYDIEPVHIALSLFSQSSELMVLFLGFYCLITALAVFSYMHYPRNTAMIHSLPLKRETLYTSNYLAGLFLVTFPLIFNSIIIIITQAVLDTGWLCLRMARVKPCHDFSIIYFRGICGYVHRPHGSPGFLLPDIQLPGRILEYIINNVLKDFLLGFSSTSLQTRPLSPLLCHTSLQSFLQW